MKEIVIKIEEEAYNQIMNGWMPLYKAANLMENVQKGTPLPKGHGKLIDADALCITTVHGFDEEDEPCRYVSGFNLDHAPTIIEADKENEQ